MLEDLLEARFVANVDVKDVAVVKSGVNAANVANAVNANAKDAAADLSK